MTTRFLALILGTCLAAEAVPQDTFRFRLAGFHQVNLAFILPDGDTAFTWSRYDQIRWWNLRSGELIRYRSPTTRLAYPEAYAVSPSKRRIAVVGEDRHLRQGEWAVYDSETGDLIRLRSYSHLGTSQVAISADDSRIVVAAGFSLYCYNIQTGALITSRFIGQKIASLAFSPDGKYLVFGAQSSAYFAVLDANDFSFIWGSALPIITNDSTTVTISPDSRFIAASTPRGSVSVWDASRRSLFDSRVFWLPILPRSLPGRTLVTAFSPDGDTLGVAVSPTPFVPAFLGAVAFWDLRSGLIRRLDNAMPGSVAAISFTPDGGQLLVSCNKATGGFLGLFDVSTFERREIGKLFGPIYSMDITPDGRYTLVCAGRPGIALVDNEGGEFVWRHTTDNYTSAIVSADGTSIFSISLAGLLAKRSLETGEIIRSTTIPPMNSVAIGQARDDTRLVLHYYRGSNQYRIALLSPDDFSILSDSPLVPSSSTYGRLELSPSGDLVLFRSHNQMAIHRIKDGVRLWAKTFLSDVLAVFSGDGEEVYALSRETLYVYRTSDGALLRTYVDSRFEGGPQLSHDRKSLWILGRQFLRINPKTGEVLEALPGASFRPWDPPRLGGPQSHVAVVGAATLEVFSTLGGN